MKSPRERLQVEKRLFHKGKLGTRGGFNKGHKKEWPETGEENQVDSGFWKPDEEILSRVVSINYVKCY